MPFTLYSESSSLVDEQWFESQLNRFTQNHYYKTCYVAEVAALKAFYSGETSVEQAATAITQPISQSPIFRPGDYSDDVVALYQLWTLLIDALVEWPPSRTADLVALFSAMTKVTDLIHRGEILDENCENPSTWAEHPYFHMVWSDKFWRTPGQVARQATNVASRKYQLELYIKQQDVDARLVAVGILEWDRAPRYMINTLERASSSRDLIVAENDGDADTQLKLEYQIPAASRWVEHNGDRLYSSLDELNQWDKRNSHGFEMTQFDPPSERWASWQKRLLEIADDAALDATTQDAAQLALRHMRNVGPSIA